MKTEAIRARCASLFLSDEGGAVLDNPYGEIVGIEISHGPAASTYTIAFTDYRNLTEVRAVVESDALAESHRPERIVRNKDNLVAFWKDGSKTVVKCHNEEFDAEKGVAMALARRLWGRSGTLRYVESIEDQNGRAGR